MWLGSGVVIRVLVAGSQLWPDRGEVHAILDDILRRYGSFTLVHGDCPRGADADADLWGRLRKPDGLHVEIERHPAEWDRYGKSAGYRRNAEMVKLGADICIVFILDDSPGSTHTKDLAEKAGIPTKVYRRSTMSTAVARRRVREDLTMRDAKIIWRNFEGLEKPFNPAGKRNFSVELTQAQAMVLLEMGWEPKIVKRTAEDPEPTWHLPVTVLFKGDEQTDPKIWFLVEDNHGNKIRTQIPEDIQRQVDRARFDRVDLTVSPYNWNVQGNSGVKAYLSVFYGTLHKDPLDRDYSEYVLRSELPQPALEGNQRPALPGGDVDEDEGIEIEFDSGWGLDEDERKAIES